ncbi:MAG: aminotransferase class I/II-fold pyridoxal phosphate-dependent enzyme [Caldilineaceae bacterium]
MSLQPFKLERYFAKYEFSVKYLLCSSDCEAMSVADLLALEPGSAERFAQTWLGYTESAGAPSLRSALTTLYESIQPEEILVHSGAEEAIFWFMHAVLQAGDHLIAHWPCYQSHIEVARSIGAEVTPWVAREENGWALDVDELRRVIRPNTKALVINTPHNPTGYLMPQAQFGEVLALARQHGLYVLSDEVYRESEYQVEDRLPAACDRYERAVSLNGTAKAWGLAGLRIGWIATHDAHLLTKMASFKDYTTICNSAPSEFLSELAVRQHEMLAGRNRALILRNLILLDDFFARHANRFVWQRPKAGPIAFPRILVGKIDDFAHDLVTQAGVLLLPASVYDHPGNHFRIGFGRNNLPEALSVLEEYLGRF